VSGDVVRVEMTGADDVARRLGRLSHDVDDMHAVFAGVADAIAAAERNYAPKVTGRLAAGIASSATRRAGGVTLGGVPYAGVQNFGWSRRGIAAHLFAQRAADPKGPQAADALAAEIRRDIRKEGLG
jgi:hypothetical protein